MVLFLWAEIGQPKLKTGASFSLSPPTARQPTITGDEVGARCCWGGSLDQGGPIEGGLTVRHSL
jgi:hypothetical protein